MMRPFPPDVVRSTNPAVPESDVNSFSRSRSLREQLQQTASAWEESRCPRQTQAYNQRAWLGGLQRLQRSLSCDASSFRKTGGQQFCNEPVPYYKKVAPFRPDWPNAHKWYNRKHGITVVDHENIVVPARDKVQKTKNGVVRASNGEVVYSARHGTRFVLDAEEVARILRDVAPHNAPAWPLYKLEQAFFDQVGRFGSWAHYKIPFKVFLSLFPKTFIVFGKGGREFVRVLHKSARVLDTADDVMVRLAIARESGHLERSVSIDTALEDESLPELRRVRARAFYRSTSEPSMRTIKLPPITK
mmetsp:Transcript_28837/g.52684  ORF Transcript_28837/g.52684 Transcript_28837/m.52684 type:complete len:302 (-) Transcript_28837:19-924(-)